MDPDFKSVNVLSIASFKIKSISEQTIFLDLTLQPTYEYRLNFVSKEAYDKERSYSLQIDIEYIGNFYSTKKKIKQPKFYDQSKVVCSPISKIESNT